ncbi:histidine kinase [Actinoallomurus sp. CA-150999]|uniref:sensor histidine kinase n=1 Tax=Actinoallomurus sp. CA-150999 TaxID=3239887 RepID=UPI003D8FF661
MTQAVPQRRASPRWTDYLPLSRGAWRNTAFVTAGVPVHLVVLSAFAVPWTTVPAADGPGWWLALVISVLLPLPLLRPLTAVQRSRFWSVLGIDVPPPTRVGRDIRAFLRSPATWRQLAYHTLAGPVFGLGGLLVIVMWAAGFAMALFYAYAWTLPSYSALALPAHNRAATLMTTGGILLLLVTPAVAVLVARLDARAARALLGPSRAEVLERQVEDLAEKRAGVVDAADAERRRIERDLHDGVQQRLVSLAMNLGLAKETLTGVPDNAMQVIAEAHTEAKEALTDLRNVVRGLHPAVLDDRGLDAALSGIAARTPLPVKLRVDVPERPAPTVEAVAYFVASEALTNVTKHARASHVEMVLTRHRNVLRMTVTDDGIGGADPSGGTGINGLRQRVASVDGTFRIISPVGGPTVITVELPCVL